MSGKLVFALFLVVSSVTSGSYEKGACVKKYLLKSLRILVHRKQINGPAVGIDSNLPEQRLPTQRAMPVFVRSKCWLNELPISHLKASVCHDSAVVHPGISHKENLFDSILGIMDLRFPWDAARIFLGREEAHTTQFSSDLVKTISLGIFKKLKICFNFFPSSWTFYPPPLPHSSSPGLAGLPVKVKLMLHYKYVSFFADYATSLCQSAHHRMKLVRI